MAICKPRGLPAFPPLFPSGEWWRHYIKARLAAPGSSLTEGVAAANASSGIKPRGWMRFDISGGSPASLALPVAGSASALKNRHSDTWCLAPGAERAWHKAEATLATVYGRCPFFEAVRQLYSSLPVSADTPAAQVNAAAFGGVADFLSLEELLPDLGRIVATDCAERSDAPFRERIRVIAGELQRGFDPALSVIDILMRLGPDAIFTLLPAF